LTGNSRHNKKRLKIRLLFDETSRRDSAERRILLLHFSDGGFLPKAATLRISRSVWTSAFATLRRDAAVTSAPLFVRMGNIHHSNLSARPTAPLKPAHSKRFA
jgi:hypothetical protein